MKAKFAALTLALCLFATGCWDRREINDVAFVTGIAVDKENDNYRVTAQIPLPSQLGGAGSEGGGGGTSGTKAFYNDSRLGVDMRDANENQQKSNSRLLYYSHMRVFIVGEDTAKQGISSILDVNARIPQNRLTAFMVIAKGRAQDILNAKASVEKYPAEMVRELAQGAMDPPRTLRRFISPMIQQGIDPIAPVMTVVNTQPGKTGKSESTIQLQGLAIFHDDKLQGFLSEEEGRALLIAMGEARNPVINIPSPKGKGFITVQLQKIRAKNQVQKTKGQYSLQSKINISAIIIENASNFDFSSDEDLKPVEAAISKNLTTQIQKTMSKVIKQYRADPMGVGIYIRRTYTSDWHMIRQDWENQYPKIGFQVQVQTKIRNTGSLTMPLAKRLDQMQR